MPKSQPLKYRELRIIGGSFRSRKIIFPEIPGLRPTPNRVRETLFNWLTPFIKGTRCLDMFAGSGALAFEALSRGACYCLLLDSSKEIMTGLEHNKTKLGLVNAEVRQATFPYPFDIPGKFDIIFLDPPFNSDYIPQALEWVQTRIRLSSKALIYIELAKKQFFEIPEGWELYKDKTAGNVRYLLLQRFK